MNVHNMTRRMFVSVWEIFVYFLHEFWEEKLHNCHIGCLFFYCHVKEVASALKVVIGGHYESEMKLVG